MAQTPRPRRKTTTGRRAVRRASGTVPDHTIARLVARYRPVLRALAKR